jgi:hypothetical protein
MIPFLGMELPSIATSAVVGIILNVIFLIFPAKQIDEEFEQARIEDLELEV